jgi:hypothetical protein
MKIDINHALPLNTNTVQQSAVHQSTVRKLQERLQQADAAPIAGSDQIIWDEAEQTMRKDGFAKLALEKDTTLSGISAEFSASAVRYNMYMAATGNSEADMEREISVVSALTEENADEYNIYTDILWNRCGYNEGFWDLNEPKYFLGAEEALAARQNDPGSLYPRAAEVRTAFADSIDAFVKKLQEDYASGAIDKEEYLSRQDKINEAYDKGAYRYGNYGMTNMHYMQGVYGLDGFSAWEGSLNDIKARYERGDFGFGEGVYEERLAAWSAAFDKWADEEVKSMARINGVMGIAVRDFAETHATDDAERVFSEDMRKLYENAKAHLLAGNSAQSLTDDILNAGLSFASAGDRRFLFSDEHTEMHIAVFRQSKTTTDKSKTQSQDKEEWEDLYRRFAMRVESDTSLSETLKNIFLEYFGFAAVRLPQIFKGNFLSG